MGSKPAPQVQVAGVLQSGIKVSTGTLPQVA
jgi:hypothetical protein